MELTVKIILSLDGERILRETNWVPDKPELPSGSDSAREDLIKTGLLFKWDDGSVHLTDVGEDVLNHLK